MLKVKICLHVYNVKDMEKLKLQINGVDIEVEDTMENVRKLRNDDKLLKQYVMELYGSGYLKDFSIHGRITSIYIYNDDEEIPEEMQEAQNEISLDSIDIDSDTDFNETLPSPTWQFAEPSTSNIVSPDQNQNDLDPRNSGMIWTTRGKPSSKDIEATDFFLSLRGNDHYMKCFNDKKSSHNILWRDIAKRMNEAGYWVGEGKVATDKLRHKFKNLTKMYMNFIAYVKRTTGTPKRDPPQFYDELHKIFGEKDKTNPKLIIDSELNTSEKIVSTESLASENLVDNHVPENPLERSDTPFTASDCVEQSVTKENVNANEKNKPARKRAYMSVNEDINIRLKNIETNSEKHFAQMFKLMNDQNKILKEQNDQRNKLINIFEKLVDKENKTRKRKYSSSSDS
ncbi:unnamed protein product [Phaedon cochleariae]|uniref:Myb/SANT-like DNA-binding domain-containing protein n=1 Tax=Phaedon cochleariae TaxID=80249 RepID=A0A9N9SFY4_PHACE|nr:unnamed protein product [Phaedon cochleariae]CAG9818157.1 unnamed protein product [Phaedon cochleariae]